MTQLAINSIDDFLYGRTPNPVTSGNGLVIGGGTMIPEINFTLPQLGIDGESMPRVREIYSDVIEGVLKRAVELDAPGLLVEFETLPQMTVHPEWGVEVTKILSDSIRTHAEKAGLKVALRLTINDTREHARPPMMRRGKYWDNMLEFLEQAGDAGADMISVESTGGKEICDEALVSVDLKTMIFALGVLAQRDMTFLWGQIVDICKRNNMTPAGDSACGFANTAMVLADQHYIPKVFAATVRVASVPRSLVAFEVGAVGPSKDCAYEGPFIKAITGAPISMEGRSAACAHLSHIGNIAQAVCDCWSNESVQHIRLLSDFAPVVSLEQLVYDCRLMNIAASKSDEDARRLRDWLVESDAALDPQAYVLKPDVVLKLSRQIADEPTTFKKTRRAVLATIDELTQAWDAGLVKIAAREKKWLKRLKEQADSIPEDEDAFIAEMMNTPEMAKCLPEEYGL